MAVDINVLRWALDTLFWSLSRKLQHKFWLTHAQRSKILDTLAAAMLPIWATLPVSRLVLASVRRLVCSVVSLIGKIISAEHYKTDLVIRLVALLNIVVCSNRRDHERIRKKRSPEAVTTWSTVSSRLQWTYLEPLQAHSSSKILCSNDTEVKGFPEICSSSWISSLAKYLQLSRISRGMSHMRASRTPDQSYFKKVLDPQPFVLERKKGQKK
jgi:hypothetical protein